MSAFRYAQFCPIARAAEILGERWTLLVLRDLFVGPQRFTDLRRRLSGVSSSVLAERLGRLEARGLVTRRELPPPAASAVYALTPDGEALLPVLVALARWGVRFLLPPVPEDHVEPDWAGMALRVFARPGPTPPLAFDVRVVGEAGEVRAFVTGGPEGSVVSETGVDPDALLRAPPRVLLAVMAGLVRADAAADSSGLAIEGDREAALRFPELFDVPLGGEQASGLEPQPQRGES